MGKKLEEGCVSVSVVQDVEEGEISDSGSVEEISAEDFSKPIIPEVSANNKAVSSNNNTDPKQQQQQIWTMQDLLKYQNKYQVSRNYGAGLHNFAWAQAVQNKPLDDYLKMEFNNNNDTQTNNLKRSSSSNAVVTDTDTTVNSSLGKEGEEVKIVIDVSGDEDDKEEGELEEGEIDLDMEVVGHRVKEEGDLINNELGGANKVNEDNNNLEKRINLIHEGLEAVTVNNAEKSYGEVCSRLQNSLDSLWKVVSESSGPKMDDLLQLSFSGIQIVNSVFCSMSQTQKEHNRGILSRLLAQVTSQKPPLFSPDRMKQVEAMFPSSDSCAVSSITKDSDKEKEIQLNQKDSDASAENANQELTFFKEECVLDVMSIEASEQNDPQQTESLKIEIPSSKSRLLLPLLDLHKDHDADSLPSPTRETTSHLPLDKALLVGGRVIKPEWPSPQGAFGMQNVAVHRYETDAFKAVSSYQQKFGRSSFLMSNRLPSPTPSEESDDAGGDISGEVSSSSNVQNVNSVIETTLARPTVFPVSHVDIPGGQSLVSVRNAAPVSSTSTSVMRVPTKSRDPRLRLANSDSKSLDLNQRPLPLLTNQPIVEPLDGLLSSRKQKAFDETVLSDGPAPKRQKSELTDSGILRDVQAVSQTGGWLEDRGTVGLQVTNRNHAFENMRSDPRGLDSIITSSVINNGMPNATSNGSERIPVTNINTTASLQSLLKDIAVNPTMWMNIIKMEQQKSVDTTKYTTQSPNVNSIMGTVPMITVAPHKPSAAVQRSAAVLQTPQTASADDLGKIRMKPRDPRRALQSHPQMGGNLGSDQPNANLSILQGTKGNLKQEDQLDKKPVSSLPIIPPDIAQQFTKNLKNIADIISVSQATVTPPVPQIPSSQPAQVHPSFVNIKGALSESGNLEGGTGQTSEEDVAGPPQSQNTWGDVEHLFEGYDDLQRAAIQRERARRIEEQKKMFSARKLCLVLDLDHTLLNSAKFVEIEPMHDEMLRKKEEQDREKPHRHLFRFPHMGMWTKLRPGIWNFLEKASKLFELHLYTMGNKLYATEMAKVLDPKGVLFNGRVISKGDDGDLIDGDERVPKSKDLEGVLGMESAVVIIDDSIRVWPHNKLNLIVVERYIYFPCSRRQFGLPGPSLLEIDHDERPEDGTLASSLAVIGRIHHNFFLQQSLDDADVRNILASEQRKILGGCRIVFSRVFPVGEANPHLHPLWQTAEQFGAVCTNQIDEQVTHVVANSLGTDKVNWALSTGRFVVHPGWVEASALLYRRASEHDFAVKP